MREQGFITYFTVIIVAAIAIAIAVSLVNLSVRYTRTVTTQERSKQAMALADACAESALQQIRSSSSYTGNNTLSLGNGSCSYIVTNTGGTTRKINASGTVGTIVRRINISISALNPTITISRWEEAANFN